MSILYTAISILQILAILYLLQISLETVRALTLCKNSSWVNVNGNFLHQYCKPNRISLERFLRWQRWRFSMRE